jgi:hypothetical protein
MIIMLKNLLFSVAIAAMLSCGQYEPLSNYEPKSQQEQALKKTLLEFEQGVNSRDSKKVENLIHERASLMTGRERKVLSKAAYRKILPVRLAENPPIALGTPKISVRGDKAEVRIYTTRGDHRGLTVFYMKLENKKWYIQGWKY